MKKITVKELKAELEKMDEDALIFVRENHMEQGNILIAPRIKENSFVIEKISCTDAFDYTQYTTEVVSETFNGTGEKCYII